MLQVVSILFGAAFTIGVSLALGLLLIHRLRLALHREEALLLGFVCGAALLSLAAFLLAVIHQARTAVFVLGGLVAIAAAIYESRREPVRKALPAAPRLWKGFFFLIFAAFFFVYFFNALAPETSPDGSGYHLGNVARMRVQHGFDWDYHSMYSYLSQGMEMLFLVAFSFGRHSAATLVHFAFQAALPLFIACYGMRFGFPRAGLFAGLMVYASPVVGKAGASAYNDLAVATIVFAVFYLLQVWDETRERNLLILVGLLAGFAYAVKYTGALALPFSAVFLWWRSRGSQRWRNLALLASAAAILILPWIVRNWIWVGNPFAPFWNRWFPNPYYHAGMEQLYLNDLQHYEDIRYFWQIPWQVAVRGHLTGGTIGPLFLLSPVALLGLRQPMGRRLLAAACVFAIPTYFNVGSRFWIPVLPFISLAMGLTLASFPAALAVVALAQAIGGWPHMLSVYSDKTNWHLGSIPVAAALRLQPEASFLKQHLPDYALKPALETLVPPGGKVFTLETRPEAYINRHFVVAYESVLGNLAQDMLAGPVDARARPTLRQSFRFFPVTTRGLRVVQTASGEGFWSIAEMRVYSQSRELPRSSDWRVEASPNAGEVQLAFDSSYATRWSSWQSISPGMFVGIDFGKPQAIDELVLEMAYAPEAKAQVEVVNERGRWIPLTDKSELVLLDIPSGLRRAATLELKARGIGYLLINDTDFLADDMRKYAKFWRLTELTAVPGIRLYQID
ncbi:MAG: hypothetical protein C5B51_16960 [Terriglobia bacterium]|nr:MAG: hypothetical protein C5B51_16960 [Terriglobia bacterium]